MSRECPSCVKVTMVDGKEVRVAKVHNGLYLQCPPCRQKGCEHVHTHYDGSLARICDHCGVVVAPKLRKVGFTAKGRGVHPLRVGMPEQPRENVG